MSGEVVCHPVADSAGLSVEITASLDEATR